MTDLDFILHGSKRINKGIDTKHLHTCSITKLQQIVIANKNAQNISFIQKIQSGKIRAFIFLATSCGATTTRGSILKTASASQFGVRYSTSRTVWWPSS